MINQILGNTVFNSQFQSTADVVFVLNNDHLTISIKSDSDILGIQINAGFDLKETSLLHNTEKEFISNDKVVMAYSLQNIPFENNKVDLVLSNVKEVNFNDIQIIVSDNSGNEMNLVRSEHGDIFSNGLFKFELGDSYPNPFNPTTELNFSLPVDGNIKLVAYNIQGQQVQKIYSGYQSMGAHKYVWDASNLTSGIYLIKLTSGNHQTTTQTILMK